MKAFIKLCTIFFLRGIMRVLSLIPMKQNRIVINAYSGSQYSCSPKYITEYILENYPGEFELIWAFKCPSDFSFLKKKGIKLVKYSSIKRFFYEATCKVSINNIGSFSWFPVRKGQEHINTWHGVGVKRCALGEEKNSPLMKKTIQMSSDRTTLFLSGGKEHDRDAIRNDLGYHGEILKCGLPRNDILFKQKKGEIDMREKVCRYLHISGDAFLVLYAPTWRYNRSKEFMHIDYNKLKNVLKAKTGKEVLILSRMHHLQENVVSDSACTVNATDYPDMQELLAVSDCLITDYSACMWDFSIMGRAIVLFAPDFEEYENERGFYTDIHEWGFPVSKNSNELIDIFRDLDFSAAGKAAEEFQRKNGSYEKGMACRQVVDRIRNK